MAEKGNGKSGRCKRVLRKTLRHFKGNMDSYYIQGDGTAIVTFDALKFITYIIGATCYENGSFRLWGVYVGVLPRLKERYGSDIYMVYEALLRLRDHKGPYVFFDEYDRIFMDSLYDGSDIDDEDLAQYIAGGLIYFKSLVVWFYLLYKDADKIRGEEEIDPPGPAYMSSILDVMYERILQEVSEGSARPGIRLSAPSQSSFSSLTGATTLFAHVTWNVVLGGYLTPLEAVETT